MTFTHAIHRLRMPRQLDLDGCIELSACSAPLARVVAFRLSVGRAGGRNKLLYVPTELMMKIWRRIKRTGRSGVAHTLWADRPMGSMGTVCRGALSLAGDYEQAPESAPDCARCASRRTDENSRGEKIGRKVKRSLYDPGTRP